MQTVSDEYVLTDETARVDVDVVHRFLSTTSGWAKGIPRATVEKSLRGSLCFSAFSNGAQVGFARIVTDRATFAYLADVFVLPEHRGRGISKRLMAFITSHPELQGLRRWLLATKDAHGLYAQYGFAASTMPERLMEILDNGIYERARS